MVDTLGMKSSSRPASCSRPYELRSRSVRCKPPLSNTALSAKIAVLDAFQYKSRFGPSDTKSVLNLLETKQNCGMHVVDLWSKRQHQSFLKSLQAVDAQKIRDRLERDRLFNASVHQVPGHTLDELYDRLMVYDQPEAAVRNYALGRPGLVKQEISSSLRASSSVRSLKRPSGGGMASRKTLAIDSLIHKCDLFDAAGDLKSQRGPIKLKKYENDRVRLRRGMHLRVL